MFTSSQAACNAVSRNDLVRLQRDGSVIRIRRGVYRLAARADIACHHHAAVDLPDVTSHRTSWLPKSDVTEIDGIPCTTLIRTIIDLAGIVDDATLIRIVDDAQRRRIDMSCLLQQATMMLATGRSGPSNVIDIVRRRLDGYSVPESWFERLLSMGLRSPALKGIVRQHELRTPTGLFVARFDLAVPAVRLGTRDTVVASTSARPSNATTRIATCAPGSWAGRSPIWASRRPVPRQQRARTSSCWWRAEPSTSAWSADSVSLC